MTREFVPYKGDESGFYRDMCLRVGKVRSPPPPVLSLVGFAGGRLRVRRA